MIYVTKNTEMEINMKEYVFADAKKQDKKERMVKDITVEMAVTKKLCLDFFHDGAILIVKISHIPKIIIKAIEKNLILAPL